MGQHVRVCFFLHDFSTIFFCCLSLTYFGFKFYLHLATVHLASHCTIPTLRAAVKVVSRTGLLLKADGDPTALHLADAVIHREVLLMKLASHDRIVKLYDFVQHGDLA